MPLTQEQSDDLWKHGQVTITDTTVPLKTILKSLTDSFTQEECVEIVIEMLCCLDSKYFQAIEAWIESL